MQHYCAEHDTAYSTFCTRCAETGKYELPATTIERLRADRLERAAIAAMRAIITKGPFLPDPRTFEVYEKTAYGALDYARALLAELDKEQV